MDLQFLKVLTGIATQGAVSKETQKSYYVTNFKLEVSTNGEDWMVYRHGKNHKVGAKGRPMSRRQLSIVGVRVESDKSFAFLTYKTASVLHQANCEHSCYAASVPEPESCSHEVGKWVMRGRKR